ncbi:hypothetical protein M427DRAFT_73383 [Gonapodya prolifera JEL478]|uniref:Uncharacterized protein n=1 Tax=Gonapodya prolifera (strain JEL478) TaxID=1344416 RepID=A0A139A2E8_GONPJ|nr:hypothetical protein M427DRAFT_73383 [Gonapodya prolifera JEL478]|eukprot:KXS10914.1 hypothetical protein M427DRAFT_73383 [Gonapodya prolifera JEL478]
MQWKMPSTTGEESHDLLPPQRGFPVKRPKTSPTHAFSTAIQIKLLPFLFLFWQAETTSAQTFQTSIGGCPCQSFCSIVDAYSTTQPLCRTNQGCGVLMDLGGGITFWGDNCANVDVPSRSAIGFAAPSSVTLASASSTNTSSSQQPIAQPTAFSLELPPVLPPPNPRSGVLSNVHPNTTTSDFPIEQLLTAAGAVLAVVAALAVAFGMWYHRGSKSKRPVSLWEGSTVGRSSGASGVFSLRQQSSRMTSGISDPDTFFQIAGRRPWPVDMLPSPHPSETSFQISHLCLPGPPTPTDSVMLKPSLSDVLSGSSATLVPPPIPTVSHRTLSPTRGYLRSAGKRNNRVLGEHTPLPPPRRSVPSSATHSRHASQRSGHSAVRSMVPSEFSYSPPLEPIASSASAAASYADRVLASRSHTLDDYSHAMGDGAHILDLDMYVQMSMSRTSSRKTAGGASIGAASTAGYRASVETEETTGAVGSSGWASYEPSSRGMSRFGTPGSTISVESGARSRGDQYQGRYNPY